MEQQDRSADEARVLTQAADVMRQLAAELPVDNAIGQLLSRLGARFAIAAMDEDHDSRFRIAGGRERLIPR